MDARLSTFGALLLLLLLLLHSHCRQGGMAAWLSGQVADGCWLQGHDNQRKVMFCCMCASAGKEAWLRGSLAKLLASRAWTRR
jgi:hypothetical protein